MSEEAAGWQTSRCALKKPWRLAGAYPNLCRKQISPGFSGDPSSPLASNKPDAEWTSTWPFVNPRPQRGNLDTITLTRAPKENEVLKNMFRKRKREERKWLQGRSTGRGTLLVLGSLYWGSFWPHPPNLTKSYFICLKTWLLGKIGGICSSAKVKARRLKGWESSPSQEPEREAN